MKRYYLRFYPHKNSPEHTFLLEAETIREGLNTFSDLIFEVNKTLLFPDDYVVSIYDFELGVEVYYRQPVSSFNHGSFCNI